MKIPKYVFDRYSTELQSLITLGGLDDEISEKSTLCKNLTNDVEVLENKKQRLELDINILFNGKSVEMCVAENGKMVLSRVLCDKLDIEPNTYIYFSVRQNTLSLRKHTDDYKPYGYVRQLDEYYRIEIPVNIRKKLKMKKGVKVIQKLSQDKKRIVVTPVLDEVTDEKI